MTSRLSPSFRTIPSTSRCPSTTCRHGWGAPPFLSTTAPTRESLSSRLNSSPCRESRNWRWATATTQQPHNCCRVGNGNKRKNIFRLLTNKCCVQTNAVKATAGIELFMEEIKLFICSCLLLWGLSCGFWFFASKTQYPFWNSILSCLYFYFSS